MLAAALAGACALLAACGTEGFHLTSAQPMNYQRVALTGFADRSTMAEEIRRALPPGSAIVPTRGESQVVVQALIDLRETTVEASTAFGQVRELELHCLLRYRVLRPDGSELLKAADFERFRDLDYDEKDALAKDTESNALYRDMQSDIARQLMRVLAALGKPDGAAARAAAARGASSPVLAASASSTTSPSSGTPAPSTITAPSAVQPAPTASAAGAR